MNHCQFDQDRIYRYSLVHDMREERDLFSVMSGNGLKEPMNLVAWIGLNPSTADENVLDPTLRRISGFTQAIGGNAFVMLNLFAFRSTLPTVMKASSDPVGPLNDEILLQSTKDIPVICCWGADGGFMGRDKQVMEILKGRDLRALKLTQDGFPGHPLYLPKTLRPIPFK